MRAVALCLLLAAGCGAGDATDQPDAGPNVAANCDLFRATPVDSPGECGIYSDTELPLGGVGYYDAVSGIMWSPDVRDRGGQFGVYGMIDDSGSPGCRWYACDEVR